MHLNIHSRVSLYSQNLLVSVLYKTYHGNLLSRVSYTTVSELNCSVTLSGARCFVWIFLDYLANKIWLN